MEQLFQVLDRVTAALRAGAIEHRVVGGIAVFLHISERDPLAARMTRDIDLAVDRRDLERLAEAVRTLGYPDVIVAERTPERYMTQLSRGDFQTVLFLDAVEMGAAPGGVVLLEGREKVRPEYAEAVPDFSPPVVTREGVLLAPVSDLVRMKLTSYRFKDRLHIQDMDRAGLITAQIEAGLSGQLRRRLEEIRAER